MIPIIKGPVSITKKIGAITELKGDRLLVEMDSVGLTTNELYRTFGDGVAVEVIDYSVNCVGQLLHKRFALRMWSVPDTPGNVVITYQTGKPLRSGKYCVRVQTGDALDDLILTWHQEGWWYPKSSLPFRGEVHSWAGPLDRRTEEG